MTLSPRQKLVGGSVLAVALPLIASLQGASASTICRAVLAVAALGGIVFWAFKARGGASKFKSAPRLNVIQRVGLSQRSGLTLVEVDGKPYLVVHGDGFARIRPTRRPMRVSVPRTTTASDVAPPPEALS